MRDVSRLFFLCWFSLCLVLFCCSAASAHDCSDESDCAAVPSNVDAATGLAGAATGGLVGLLILMRNRNRREDLPCQALRDEAAAGEERIRRMESDIDDARKQLGGIDIPDGPINDRPQWIANMGGALHNIASSGQPFDPKDFNKGLKWLKQPVRGPGGRRPRAEKTSPEDKFFDLLQILSAAKKALNAEKIAQKARLAALAACEQSAAPAQEPKQPVDVDALARSLDDVKEEFEKLQEELRHQVGDRLNEIDKLVKDYDSLWADAMKALDDYFAGLNRIAGPLRDLWNARADMDWALALADAGDEALQALQMVAPALLELRALNAAREAELALALGRASDTAAKYEAKQALEQIVKKAVTDEERAVAKKALNDLEKDISTTLAKEDLKAAEKAITDGEAQAARQVEAEAASRAQAEADLEKANQAIAKGEAEKIGQKAIADAKKIEAEATAASEKAAARQAEATQARMDAEAKLAAAGPNPPQSLIDEVAQKKTIEEITSINQEGIGGTGRDTNCVLTANQYEQYLRGNPGWAGSDPFKEGYTDEGLEALYGGKFRPVADEVALRNMLANNPNSRGIVSVEWANPQSGLPGGHTFNAINRNGTVLFQDAQVGDLFNDWGQVKRIWFMPTH